jgi:hypothetical protein
MLLWIAVVGASLGLYSLSLAPFSLSWSDPSAAERPHKRELGDD